MIISLQLSSLITLLGVTTALTLTLLLWFSRGENQQVNRYLSLILALSSLLASTMVLNVEGIIASHQGSTIFALQLALGPLLYFYACKLTQRDFRWQKKHYWHLLPALLAALIWQLQLSSLPIDEFFSSTIESRNLLNQSRFWHRITTFISVPVYAIAVLRLLSPYQAHIKERCSAIDEVNLNWLKTLSYGFLFGALAATLLEIHAHFTDQSSPSPGSIYSLPPLLLSLFLGVFGIQQQHICDEEKPKAESNSEADVNQGRKYQTSSLSPEGAVEIWNQLQQLMSTNKPYLEHGLKISGLAQQLQVSTSHLSETINGHAKQSFYEFINQQRVEEAKRQLADASLKHLSGADIGFQSGFNSNSTFFTHFKKYQQQTPQQYRKQV